MADTFITEVRHVWLPKSPHVKDPPGVKRVDDYYVEREVAVCTGCQRHAGTKDPKQIEHDALCTVLLTDGEAFVRSGRRGGEQQTATVLKALFQRAAALLGVQPSAALTALQKLREYRPARWPDGYDGKKPRGAEKGDEVAPFFSEAYLYPLMGKDEARTILALLHHVEAALKVQEP